MNTILTYGALLLLVALGYIMGYDAAKRRYAKED